MSAIVKVTTVGSSVGIVLPKEILSKLHVEKGDSLYITETPDGVHSRRMTKNLSDRSKSGKESCVSTATRFASWLSSWLWPCPFGLKREWFWLITICS